MLPPKTPWLIPSYEFSTISWPPGPLTCLLQVSFCHVKAPLHTSQNIVTTPNQNFAVFPLILIFLLRRHHWLSLGGSSETITTLLISCTSKQNKKFKVWAKRDIINIYYFFCVLLSYSCLPYWSASFVRTKMCPFCWLLCPQTLGKCLEYEVLIYFYQNVCNEWIRKWFWDFIYFTTEFCSLNTEFTPKIYWWLPFGFWWKEDPPVLPEFYTGKKVVTVRSTCRIWGKNNMFFHALGGLAPRDRESSEVRGSPAVWPVRPELLASSAPSFPTRGLAVVMPRLVYRAKGRKRASDQMAIPVWSIHSQDRGEEGGLMGKWEFLFSGLWANGTLDRGLRTGLTMKHIQKYSVLYEVTDVMWK